MLIYTNTNDQEKKLVKYYDRTPNQCNEFLKLESLKSFILTLSDSETKDFDLSSHVKSTLFTDHTFKNEDLEACYVTLIKFLLRNVKPTVLNRFYNVSDGSFLILKPLLHYSHHSDAMIKNAARIGLMTIFQNCSGEAMKYILSVTIPEHLNDIILNLKQNAIRIQSYFENSNQLEVGKMCQYYEEELEYIDDILNLKNYEINTQIHFRLVVDFIVPYLLTPIVGEIVQECIPSIFTKTALYLLYKFLETVTYSNITETIMNIIIQEEHISEDIKISIEECYGYTTEIVFSIQYILQKYHSHINALYTLQILNIMKSRFYETCKIKLMKFYERFQYALIKSLIYKNQCNGDNECYQLKLLISILEPLTEKIAEDRWLKLKEFLLHSLDMLYADVCQKVNDENIPNLVSVIDKEYQIFTNINLNTKVVLNNETYLMQEKNIKIVNNTTLLQHLFSIRCLYLTMNKHEEKILPLLQRKENIGDILFSDNCLPCKKLIHKNFYDNKHFIKLTSTQMLLLQYTDIEDELKGIVVFNSYYKDISWSKHKNNTLTIHELCNDNQLCARIPKPIFMHLKFNDIDDLHFTLNFLAIAKSKQIQIIEKKFEDLLQKKMQ